MGANEGVFNADLNTNINVSFTDDGGLAEFLNAIKKISKGNDLQKYWKNTEQSIKSTTRALKKYSENTDNFDFTSNAIKEINALKAITGKDNIIELIPEIDESIFKDLENKAKDRFSNISLNFSVENYKQVFETLDNLKSKGYDVLDILNQLSNYWNIKSERNESNQKYFDLKNLLGDMDSDQVKKELEKFKNLKDQAEEIFESFLKINNIERTNYWGDEKFQEYFDGIKNGSLTATDAIAKFKTEYSYLLEESFKSNNDTFGLEQLQAFSNKLDSIFKQVEETSNKINDIISNGVVTKSVQDMAVSSSTFANLLQDEESLKSITAILQKLIEESKEGSKTELFDDEQLQNILSVFDRIEEHLLSLRKVISDVGDGEEFSPLLKIINELKEATSNIKLNFNLDLGNQVSERLNQKVSQAGNRQLEAYRKLFSAMKATGKTNKEMIQFYEPDDASNSELIGIYKSIIDRAEKQFGDYYKNRVVNFKELKNEIKNANQQLYRAETKKSETGILNELFGGGNSEELKEIISRLELIAEKIGEMSISAKNFADIFKDGINISSSLEEINKLTDRVKELEDELSKIKSATPPSPAIPNETNILSGDTTTPLVEEQNELQKELDETIAKIDKLGKTYNGLTYRGVDTEDAVAKPSENYNGATHWTTDEKTARGHGSIVTSGNVSLKNALEIDGNGLHWDKIHILGDGLDENSKKAIEFATSINKAYDELKELVSLDDDIDKFKLTFPLVTAVTEEIGRLIDERDLGNNNEEEIKIIQDKIDKLAKLRDEYFSILTSYDEFSRDTSHPYGLKTTDELTAYAQNNGYDGAVYKNIVDTKNGIIISGKEYMEASDVIVSFYENQVEYLEKITRQGSEYIRENIKPDDLFSRYDFNASDAKDYEGIKKMLDSYKHISKEMTEALSREDFINYDNLKKVKNVIEDKLLSFNLGSVEKTLINRGFNIKKAEEDFEKLFSQSNKTPVLSDNASTASEQFKESASSAEKLQEEIKEVKQETDKATESAKEYKKILSQVGEYNVDANVSAVYKRNDGQLESVKWKAKRDKGGNILYDKNGNIDYDVSTTVISKYEQLEKIIVKADNKLKDLQKNLADTKAYDQSASTVNIEEQIRDQKEYIALLEETVKNISKAPEYLMLEQQIIEARNKAAREYALNVDSKKEMSDAKQNASDEKKRLANIEQVNRALNRQQIAIDSVEKSYDKSKNPDLDREVSNQQDLLELQQKKATIQTKINSLQNQERNSSNEKEFLELEKLISEYKELATYKIKANNPSKRELGGQKLEVSIGELIPKYESLILKAEKYGTETEETVSKLKEQLSILMAIDKNTGKHTATADDYYTARDTYKVEKAGFSGYEAEQKEIDKAHNEALKINNALNETKSILAELGKINDLESQFENITARIKELNSQLGSGEIGLDEYKSKIKVYSDLSKNINNKNSSEEKTVEKALNQQVSAWKEIQNIRYKISQSDNADEISRLQKQKEEYQKQYVEAKRILTVYDGMYDKELQLAKLEQIRYEITQKIIDANESYNKKYYDSKAKEEAEYQKQREKYIKDGEKQQSEQQRKSEKELEKQQESQQSKWRKFQQEQQDYLTNQYEYETIERNKKAYQELLDTIKRYSDISKRIASGKALDGDVEEAKILEDKISELQKQPILSHSQVEKSERELEKLFVVLDDLEKKLIESKEKSVNKDWEIASKRQEKELEKQQESQSKYISKKSESSYNKEIKLEEEINRLKIKNLSASDAEVAANNILIARKEELIRKEREYRKASGLSSTDGDSRLINRKNTLSQDLDAAQQARLVIDIEKKSEESYKKQAKLEKEIHDLKIKNISASKDEVAKNEELIAYKHKLAVDEAKYRENNGLNNKERFEALKEERDRLKKELLAERQAYNKKHSERTKLGADTGEYMSLLKNTLNENLGDGVTSFDVVNGKGDGSATIKMIKEIGEETVTTTFHIKDMLEVLDQIGSNEFNLDDLENSSTSKNNNKNKLDEISKAYKGLIDSEEKYQRLSQKQSLGEKLTTKENEDLKRLTAEREKYNAVVNQSLALTKQQLELQEKYQQKQSDVATALPAQRDAIIEKQIADIEKLGTKPGEFFKKLKDGKAETVAFNELSDEIKRAITLQNNYADSVMLSEEQTKRLNTATKKLVENFNKEINSNRESIASSLKGSLDRIVGSKQYDGEVVGIINKVNEAIKRLSKYDIFDAGDINTAKEISNLITEIKQGLSSIKSNDNDKHILPDSEDVYKGISSINKVLSGGFKMPRKLREEFIQLKKAYESAFDSNKNITITKNQLQELDDQLAKLNAQFDETGRKKSIWGSLSTRLTDMNAKFLAQYFSFQDIIRYARQGIQTIREFDTALTEMRKVSDESVASLKRYQRVTFDIGDSVGATAKTIQNSTADWMRLGESIDEAAESARVSNILLNVSEFESVDEATKSLVSMSQAYQELEKIDIVDKINNIGNNYSIATDELASGMQNAAAVLKTQGNDIDKAIALITAGNAITQDAEKTSAGIRTIALRIAGTEEAKDELAELGEDVDDFVVQTASKTQQIIKDYTAVASNAYKGVDVLDANGNLRDTYDILLDIAKVYKEIQETDKIAGTNRAQALVEALAGKNRSNIASSILLNPELLESVYETSKDSANSAQNELNAYLDSIDGRHFAMLYRNI